MIIRRAAAAGVVLAVLGAAGGAGAPAVAADPAGLPALRPAAGGDLVSVRLADTGLVVRVRDAGQVARAEPGHEPDRVQLQATSAARVPARPEYGFLGTPGAPVWTLTGSSTQFPAWDTTGVPAGRLVGDTVTLQLRAVAGPGRFHAYTLSPVGAPHLLLGSSAGAPQSADLPAGTRQDGLVWAFEAPGSYRLEFVAIGELAGGAPVAGQASYRVEVPDLAPPAALAPATGATAGPAGSAGPAAGDEPAAAPGPAAATGPGLGPGPAPAPRRAPPPAPLAQAGGDQTATGRTVIADGHVDMGPRLLGDEWTVQIRDDTGSPPVWRELADVVLHAVDQARIVVPGGGAFAFLGEPGDEIWVLPQTEQAGVLWPGWNTQHPSVVEGVAGNVTWTLRGVSGPGAFKLFLTGSFGNPEVLFDTAEPLPQQLSIPPNTHAHGNWVFTEPGIYRLAVELSATASGRQLSDTGTLTVVIGSGTDPATAFPGGGSGSGGDPGAGNGGGPLAGTGLPVLVIVGAGMLLALTGAGLLLVTRRRRFRPAGQPEPR